MTSRLDRLFILLESGSSSVTRRAAAKQIGEVQKLYPHELHTLLNRLIGYLHSSSWDTRIAAALAVEAILVNVPAWQPEKQQEQQLHLQQQQQLQLKRIDKKERDDSYMPLSIVEEENSCQSSTSGASGLSTYGGGGSGNGGAGAMSLLSFADFDVEQILNKGARLIGSEGAEFDIHDEDSAAINPAERLSRQRALLNENLGLAKASKLGFNLTEMISDDDILTRPNVNSIVMADEKVPVQRILNQKLFANSHLQQQQLSCREINRAKRKARQSDKQLATTSGNLSRSNSTTTATSNISNSMCSSSTATTTTTTNNNNINDEPDKKKFKTDSQRQEIFYGLSDPVPDVTGNWLDAVNWPLDNFCARLFVDLFSAKWEVRHGAATALRELINNHCHGAGKSINMTLKEMQDNHNRWLEDAALRLLCVLCLDRFGDYISDQVVAPVRETCAQVLGTLVKEMPSCKVDQIVGILLKLLKQNQEWEVRHGGLLGLKYVFVVRQDLLQIYLPQTINDILLGLFDAMDDVGAVAASTLIPVASCLPKLLTPMQVSSIVKMLWDLLLDQDELTSACNSFMGLLAAILQLPNAYNWIQMEPMAILVPRLWPFLCHTTSSVRRSTLQTLESLTGSCSNVIVKADIKIERETTTAVPTTTTLSFDSKNLNLNFGVKDWPWQLLQEALRNIYQRILVEPQADIQFLAQRVWSNLIRFADLGALLHAACPFVSSWICLAMQPARLAFDAALLVSHKNSSLRDDSNGEMTKRRMARIGDDIYANTVVQKLYLGGSEATPIEIRERNYMRARVTASRVLGALSHYLVQPAPGVTYDANSESPMDCYTKVLLGHLTSRSAIQRIVCGLIIAFWALADSTVRPGPLNLQEKLQSAVMECVYYDEVALSFTRLLQEAHDLIATWKQYKLPIDDFSNAKVLTMDQIEAVATTLTNNLYHVHLKAKLHDMLEERRRSLQNSFQQTSAEQSAYNVSAQAALAGAIVCLGCLPDKLNPVVRPLMESIKREDCELLQDLSADFLVNFMEQVCDRNPSPNNKILNNLCMLLKNDAEFTPKIINTDLSLVETTPPNSAYATCYYYGILTLSLQNINTNQRPNNLSSGSGNVVVTRGPGRPPLSETLAAQANAAAVAATSAEIAANLAKENELKLCRIQRIGATCAITKLCDNFGENLFEKLPVFQAIMFDKIKQFLELHQTMESLSNTPIDVAQTNDLITSLQLIEIAAPHIYKNLHEPLFLLLPQLGVLICHPLKAIRHLVARCFATLAYIDASVTMEYIVHHTVVLLSNIENVIQRQGAVEAICCVVNKLQIKIVPYIVCLVVPLLGCMSDSNESVRLLSAHCFATLVQLMPLDSRDDDTKNGTIKDESKFIKSEALQVRKTRDRQFLDYLFQPKSIPDYCVPVKISVELRTYQQAGVNWLWFLNKYNLHGILCDDMGLGKTLQTICILAGEHFERNQQNDKITKALLPSLVICPPTLTGHWIYEVEKFLQQNQVLRPLHYVGLPVVREKLRSCISGSLDHGGCNLVIVSYDTIRKDIDFFSSINWNYCVLDEGHIIKNGKTKSSKAIKQLKAQHRLILSGTPIQNNVLELWSLFDFLMPGFLGTEKQFIARYSRPIIASRDSKSSSKEQEAGVLAMEALHRQVLPFLLRRVKEDVLKDLPPKITQDLLCELSPLQERLYEDFSRFHLKSELKDCLEQLSSNSDNKLNSKSHIFHALRYLQNVCNHPKLVLTPKHPEHDKITRELQQHNSSLNNIEHSAKLPALKQLLLDCGIGVQTESVSQHRALIFCQLKAMLDIVERDLLRAHLPSVTFLRLDGSVSPCVRQCIVNNFNSDPSIDVLLLTTQVGGLGLNLTGADTVIFVEHDWNPMKDLQAMDRAHRIGQKKVVNVYRLITRKSLEEKIMGLQKFKLLTVNTVVTSENASMDSMATEQLFDLFSLKENGKNEQQTPNAVHNNNNNNKNNKSLNTVIENLPELWSEHQYDEEYDLANFVQTLKK